MNKVVGVVCEGKTDFLLIKKIITDCFSGSVDVKPIQPTVDKTSGEFKNNGGWLNVYKWCLANEAVVSQNNFPLFANGMDSFYCNFTLIHLDTDICEKMEELKNIYNPIKYSIKDPAGRYNYVKGALSSWLNSGTDNCIFCIAVECIETWIYAGISDDESFGCEAKNDIHIDLARLYYRVIKLKNPPSEIKKIRKSEKTYGKLIDRINISKIEQNCFHFSLFINSLADMIGTIERS